MVYFILISGIILIIVIFGVNIHSGKEELKRKENEVNLRLQELQEAVDKRNKMVDRWKEFYQSDLAQYGEPDSYIGPSDFAHNAYYPWDFVYITLGKLEGDTAEKKLDNIRIFSENLDTAYRVPRLEEACFFWEENKLAFIGGRFLQPKEIVSVKKSKDKLSGSVSVTIVTRSLAIPTTTVTFSEYDSSDAEDLVNTLSAFRHLK